MTDHDRKTTVRNPKVWTLTTWMNDTFPADFSYAYPSQASAFRNAQMFEEDPRAARWEITDPDGLTVGRWVAGKKLGGSEPTGTYEQAQRPVKLALTTAELHRLDCAVIPLTRMGPLGIYLVGSATERADHRDVDVRMIFRDDEFDARFPEPRMWEAFCYAWSRVLSADSGLRVDFQVQRMTEANEKHPGSRNPLTGGRRMFAGLGDATPYIVHAESEAEAVPGA